MIAIVTFSNNALFVNSSKIEKLIEFKPPYYPARAISSSLSNVSDIVEVNFTCRDIIGFSTCIIGHNDTGPWTNVTNKTLPIQTTSQTYH